VVVSLPLLHLLPRHTSIASSASVATIKPWLLFDMRWSLAITVIWALTSLYRTVDLASHSIRLRKLWKNAEPIPSIPQVAITSSRTAIVCSTNELSRPSVIGFLSPRILIPAWLLPKLSQSELDQIILHESEHLRRADDWTNLAQKLGLILFPVNPVLLWLEKRLCFEREMACDEGVVQKTQAPRAYAICLTRLAERSLERHSRLGALSLGTWQRRSELVVRVHSILLRKKMLPPVVARAFGAALIAGLALGTTELARCPQLIAFVPSNQADAQQANLPSGANPAPRTGARFRPEIYRPVAAFGSDRPHLVEANAVVSMHHANYPLTSNKLLRTNHPRPAVIGQAQPHIAQTRASQIVSMGVPDSLRADAVHETRTLAIAEAQMPAPSEMSETQLSAETYSDQQQSWVVFTRWEQASNQNPAVHNKPAADQSASQPAPTQLVFRLVDPNSASPTFAAVPFRNGWLVIQL
jgi:beta-lactamase regulating signal transducer with metallopeptidase domain